MHRSKAVVPRMPDEAGVRLDGQPMTATVPRPPQPIIVTAAVIERDGLLLVARRLSGTHMGGCWEFPGGKCEPGEAPDVAVHHGGPVEPGRGFILHSADWGGQDTLHVNGDDGEIFAMTGTIDVLRAIAEGRGPKQWIAALGYAGWGEGQLDEEMTRHGWFAARGDPKILFDTPTDERWAASFKAEGIDPRLLASETGAA